MSPEAKNKNENIIINNNFNGKSIQIYNSNDNKGR